MKASYPGKVGGGCCHRDCHPVALKGGKRTAEPPLLRSSEPLGLGKWPDGRGKAGGAPRHSAKMEITPLSTLRAFGAAF